MQRLIHGVYSVTYIGIFLIYASTPYVFHISAGDAGPVTSKLFASGYKFIKPFVSKSIKIAKARTSALQPIVNSLKFSF